MPTIKLNSTGSEMTKAQQECRNCGAVIKGEYCSDCGQREGRADQRFADLAHELGGELVEWDSRIWRTLFALLFRPGFLSAEYMAGRRARYAPPLRLYLIISFIMFLVLSVSTMDVINVTEDPVLAADPDTTISVDADGHIHEMPQDPNETAIEIGLADADSSPFLQELDSRLEANLLKLRADPGRFVEELIDYMPQMMFLLLPMFALLIQLAYLMSRFHYLQHFVFSLHYHSFAYLLLLIQQLLERLQSDAGDFLFVGLLIYLPLAFRTAYGSGLRGAVFKALFIYISYGLVLVAGFVAVAFLALVLL